MGGGLGGAAEDDRGRDGQELKRTLGTGCGWQEVSDAHGAGAINQTFISAVSQRTGNHHLHLSVLEVHETSNSFLLLLIIGYLKDLLWI